MKSPLLIKIKMVKNNDISGFKTLRCWIYPKPTIVGIFLTFMSRINFMLSWDEKFYNLKARPWGYETFFMLNSAEYKIYPAHKC